MKWIIAVVAALFAVGAVAAKAQVCDVYYLVDVNTEGNDVGTTKGWLYGVPVADLDDNSKRSLRVIDMLSKADGKGGPYEIEVGEWRTCDGVTTQRAANSLVAKGVRLKDSNKINHVALQIANEIQAQRFDKRAERGEKGAWNHDKARKVKRNDIGVKQHDDPLDKLTKK